MIATPCEEEIATPATEPAPARRGGGPRSPEGRAKSRMNALKYGLRAKVLIPEDLADAILRHEEAFGQELRPETPYQGWLVSQAALAAAKLDRCQEMRLADLCRVAEQAEEGWDLDRRQAAEDLARKLPDEPARISLALQRSRHGCDYLIERWDVLAHIARVRGTWDEAQRRLAFDLLGVPAEFRADSTRLPADADAATLEALAVAEAADLRRRRDGYLARIDAMARESALDGRPVHEDADSARLRRYEAECRRDLRWALAEFRKVRPTANTPAPARPPAPAPTPAPAPAGPGPGILLARSLIDAMKAEDREQPAAPAPTPAPSQPMNRRARRALEKQARKAGR